MNTIFRLRPFPRIRPANTNSIPALRYASTLEKPQELVYEGPLAKAVRTMKAVSVTSSILTTFGMPTLLVMTKASQEGPLIGKIAMTGSVMLFTLGTTTCFHLLFRTYISRMFIDRTGSDPSISVETYSLLSRKKITNFKLSQAEPLGKTMHPMVSFKVDDKMFFIHPECFEDKELAEKLLCRPLKENETNVSVADE